MTEYTIRIARRLMLLDMNKIANKLKEITDFLKNHYEDMTNGDTQFVAGCLSESRDAIEHLTLEEIGKEYIKLEKLHLQK